MSDTGYVPCAFGSSLICIICWQAAHLTKPKVTHMHHLSIQIDAIRTPSDVRIAHLHIDIPYTSAGIVVFTTVIVVYNNITTSLW